MAARGAVLGRLLGGPKREWPAGRPSIFISGRWYLGICIWAFVTRLPRAVGLEGGWPVDVVVRGSLS